MTNPGSRSMHPLAIAGSVLSAFPIIFVASTAEAQSSDEPSRMPLTHYCSLVVETKPHRYFVAQVPARTIYAIVESGLPNEELNRQWSTAIQGRGDLSGARCRAVESREKIKADLEDSARSEGIVFEAVDFAPTEEDPLAGQRKTKSIFFRDPTLAEDKRGYPTTTFDIEYQLIACMGELHLAYSLVADSVRQDKPGYWLNNQYWSLKSPPPAKITNLPLKGTVYIPPLHNEPIGTFGDNFAGPALGFGCFSGQTKKIADLKDHVGENPSKEEIQKFIDKLEVSFETSEVLRSAAAEEEIRSGIAAAATPPPLNESVDRSPTIREAAAAAEATAADRRAAREAEFQVKVKRYEEELAAQQAAVAEYEAAKEQVAAEKAANAAKAQAAQEEFAKQRAAYEAELERHRQQQAEYEAQIGAASVTTPEQ